MRSKKLFKSVLCTTLALAMPLSIAGCNQATPNTPETLEIFVGNFGYGRAWLDKIIASFKQEDWVKAKYPNLQIPTPKSNAVETYVEDTINSETTTIDLFFSARSATPSFNKCGSDGKSLYAELSDLYGSTIPGEEDTLLQKMDDTIASHYKIDVEGLGFGYHAVPWVKGYLGLLYNKKITDKLGADYKLPNTTDELKQMCEDILDIPNSEAKPFIFNTGYDYQFTMTMTWWAQYEGLKNYANYYNGIHEGEYSTEIFKQQGRLESLKVMESLYGADTGYYDMKVNSWTFNQAQSHFLDGKGAMQVNGDWFENETANKAQYTDAEISFMKVPVISAIKNKCSTIPNDSILSAVIDAIDNGLTSYTGVSSQDFATVKEARQTVNLVEGHDAYIPSYSNAVGLAKDFLLYLATDKSIETFTRETNGAITPFDYDIETQNPSLYAEMSDMQKAKLEIFDDGKTMPIASLCKFTYFGGLTAYSQTGNLTFAFTAPNAANRKTAQQIYDAEIEHYTKSDGEMFKLILRKMGLN